jgi:hypothetical protein
MDQDVKDILVSGDELPDTQKLIAGATAKLREELQRKDAEAKQLRDQYDRVAKIATQSTEKADKAEADLHGLVNYTTRAEHSAISNALAAADAEVKAMKADLAVAIETADGKRASDLAERIGDVQARRHTLVNGKERIEEEMERARNAPAPEPKQRTPIPPADPYEAAIAQLPENQKQWLRQHKDKGYIVPGKEASPKLLSAYYQARDAGLREDSPAFTAHMDRVLGHSATQQQPRQEDASQRFADAPAPQQTAKRPIPAAPPSRAASGNNAASGGRQYALTREQAQTAQRFGMSPADYIAGIQEGIKRGKLPASALNSR